MPAYSSVLSASKPRRIPSFSEKGRAPAEDLFAGEEFGAATSVEKLVRLLRES